MMNIFRKSLLAALIASAYFLLNAITYGVDSDLISVLLVVVLFPLEWFILTSILILWRSWKSVHWFRKLFALSIRNISIYIFFCGFGLFTQIFDVIYVDPYLKLYSNFIICTFFNFGVALSFSNFPKAHLDSPV